MAEKIVSIMIFEIMGKPADYIVKTLKEITDKIPGEKGVRITSRRISEPKPVEKSEVFTSFAEIEMELDSMQTLLGIIFLYMPAHVEIIEPDTLKIKNFDFNVMANELVRRLHEYDGIAKVAQMENYQLMQKFKMIEEQIKMHQPTAVVNDKPGKTGKVKKKSRSR